VPPREEPVAMLIGVVFEEPDARGVRGRNQGL
jgi:hypothetical protein